LDWGEKVENPMEKKAHSLHNADEYDEYDASLHQKKNHMLYHSESHVKHITSSI